MTSMRIPDIRDPGLFQRLVQKLMICEHGVEYQVVDDSGGDSGLDGFNRSNGDLHAIYCPEKPEAARFREKFRSDLKKAVALRDAKQYAVKRFIFVTPEPLREPDQMMLRDLARSQGFNDGINLSGEHLEALLANHSEILPQFPEIPQAQIEKKLDRVLDAVEQIRKAQGLPPTRKISGMPLQILMLAVQAANKSIEGNAECEEIFRILGPTNDQYRDAVAELHELGLIYVSKSSNAPGGYQRVRIRPDAFVQVAPQVLPGVDTRGEMEKLIQAFGSGCGEYVSATDILQLSLVPLARAQVLIDFLEMRDLIATQGMGDQSDSLLFQYGRIMPLGKRILEGKDPLPT